MNHIFRLVWCRSRRVLVVASELASSHHGSSSSTAGTVDGRGLGSTNKLLLVALVGTSGALFASGASAQSVGDAKLDDLQSLVAKYDTPHSASAAQSRIAPSQSASVAVSADIRREAASSPATTASSSAAAMPPPALKIQALRSRHQAIRSASATTSTAQAVPRDDKKKTANAVEATATKQSWQPPLKPAQTPMAAAGPSAISGVQAADAADRKLVYKTRAPSAPPSSAMKTPDHDVPATPVPPDRTIVETRQVLWQRAQTELAAGRRLPALAACEQLLAQWPDDDPARHMQVRILSELGAAARASQLTQGISPPPDEATRRALQADLATHEIRWAGATPADPRQPYVAVDRAVADIDTVIAEADKKQPALAARARTDRLMVDDQSDHAAAAVKTYRQLLATNHPLPSYAKAAAADALLQQHHPFEAATLYEQSARELPGPYSPGETDPRSGLMYAYLESGRSTKAIALADQTAASVNPFLPRHGTAQPVRNPAKLQADLNAVLVREYSDLLADAQRRLLPLLQQAPMNAQLWREYGNLQRARGWPRAAERSQTIALGIDPNDLSTKLGVLDDWRQLHDYSLVQPTLTTIEKVLPRSSEVQRERQSWDRERGWQFDLEHERGRGSTPNLGDADHQTQATLASPLLDDHWRVEGLIDQTSASLPEGSIERDRAGLGLLGYMRDLQFYARVLAAAGGRAKGTALEAGATWAPSDHWVFGGDWSKDGDGDLPIRASYYGITAEAVHASVQWRASELTEAGFGVSRVNFSDSNRSEGWQSHVMQRLFTVPQMAIDGGLELGSSHNSNVDVPYYSPSHVRWAALDLRLQNLLFQRYEQTWRQQIDVQAGSYDERGFGSSWMASARYGQSIEPRAGLSFGWKLGWSSQPYDGKRDARVTLDLTMHWGE
jgi:biofilm PGA synthesis protein PgaA